VNLVGMDLKSAGQLGDGLFPLKSGQGPLDFSERVQSTWLKPGVPVVENCDWGPQYKKRNIGRMAENRVVYRTVIADDSEEFRDWLRPILERGSDFEVIGEASSGKETLEICLQLQPDLLIMDVFMPDGEGPQVAPNAS